jgi:peptide deformylase
MAVLPILKYGDPILNKKALPADPADPGLKDLVRDMAETMHAAHGVGLAGNQVGVLKRVVVIDTSGGDDPAALRVLLNPEVLELSGEVEEEEGCLSLPEPGSDEVPPPCIREKTRRAAFCRAKAQGLDGAWYELAGDGLLGKALQHEIDHLNGILFVERVGLARKALLSGRLKALKREAQAEAAARSRRP